MTPLAKNRRTNDAGAALMTVIMMLALVSALTLTLAVITINNLASARMSQQAGAALNAADAGIAQAVTYLRENGVKELNACSPACAANPWGNKTTPAKVTIPGKSGQTFEVWIEPLVKYPDNKVGYYRITSKGVAGGPAGRVIQVDAEVSGLRLPVGVMAESVNGGGTADVHYASIFSTGCIYKRSRITFEGIDAAWGIPAAAHTSQIISDDQGSGKYCPGTTKPIHDPSAPAATRNCNIAYPYDQDANGGPLVGTPCYRLHNGVYPETSLIASDQDLYDKYNVSSKVFTQAQLDQLKTVATSQGNYHTSATGWTAPTKQNSVMYFDLAKTNPGGLVDLNGLSPTWSRPTNLGEDDTRCEPKSLLIIIEGGNARINSNSTVFASVFAISKDPYGNITKANGTSTFIGTLYGNNLDLTGTADIYMDKCFLSNTSPALTNVRTFNYREIDR
jgi:hypothetical protein